MEWTDINDELKWSTSLLRLKKHLRKMQFRVFFFADVVDYILTARFTYAFYNVICVVHQT